MTFTLSVLAAIGPGRALVKRSTRLCMVVAMASSAVFSATPGAAQPYMPDPTAPQGSDYQDPGLQSAASQTALGNTGQSSTNGQYQYQNQSQPQSQSSTAGTNSNTDLQPTQVVGANPNSQTLGGTNAAAARSPSLIAPTRLPVPPNDFQKYVADVLGRPMPRFGANLLATESGAFAPSPTATVPPDYRLAPGDEVMIRLTGSVESDLRAVVDNDGRLFIPTVGAVNVVGVRYGDLGQVLTSQVGQKFKNFKLSVSIGRLRGVRVYVTGYALAPGAYTLNSLSTLVNAVIAAGGPSASGSFRSIQLRRHDEVVTNFDLYDLLLRGDKTHDAVLQDEDVIYIGPVGPEVAITGSVNQEAVYEAKPGETFGDLLADAAGPNSLADSSRAFLRRLSNADKTMWAQMDIDVAKAMPIERGDIFRIVSAADVARPLEGQAILVKIEGEVEHPGRYFLPPGSTLDDLLAKAGALTPRAYVFGAEFDRFAVQQQQQQGFNQALRDLELTLASAPLNSSREDAASIPSRLAASQAVLNRLRERRPDGRIVLPLTPTSAALPGDFLLENEDRIYIPPKPTTVGVFGAVFHSGSFYVTPGRTIGDYLKMAGGPERMADKGSIFVVRANGAVIGQHGGPFSAGVLGEAALPGDVIFVPVKAGGPSVYDKILDVALVVYELGLGAAAIKVLAQ